MKYHNKQKRYRRKTWSIVDGPPLYRFNEAKRWCQLNGSNDKFFSTLNELPRYNQGEQRPCWPWYFENSEDALVFKLVWSYK